MHAKSGLRVVLKWKIYRPDSVIAAVMSLRRGNTMVRLVAVILIGLILGCNHQNGTVTSTSNSGQRPELTNEVFYKHWSAIPGPQLSTLTSVEVVDLLNDQEIMSTAEFVPKNWPTDSGKIRFLYDVEKSIYWSHRTNKMNSAGWKRICGPFEIPND